MTIEELKIAYRVVSKLLNENKNGYYSSLRTVKAYIATKIADETIAVNDPGLILED